MYLKVSMNRICVFFSNFNAYQISNKHQLFHRIPVISLTYPVNSCHSIHTASPMLDLMEFFDDKENWGKLEILVGRSWKVEELRIKSNSDLHKLWYVLLKEKNMLLTMQHECNSKNVAFPNPERIDKVEESMENLEKIVRERNRAYYELETGDTGERPIGESINCFGLPYRYKMSEHVMEKRFNKKFFEFVKLNNITDDHHYVSKFLTKLNEKRKRVELHRQRKLYHAVCTLLKIFPNIDEEALKARFPDVDIEKAKKDKISKSPFSYMR